MSCKARVSVTFVMEVASGRWGEEATIAEMRRVATRDANDAANRLIHLAAEHRIVLRSTVIDAPVVFLEPEEVPRG